MRSLLAGCCCCWWVSSKCKAINQYQACINPQVIKPHAEAGARSAKRATSDPALSTASCVTEKSLQTAHAGAEGAEVVVPRGAAHVQDVVLDQLSKRCLRREAVLR